MNLRTLTNDELLRRAYIHADPLVATELEAELARRLIDSDDEGSERLPLLDVLDNFGVDSPENLEAAIRLHQDAETFDGFAKVFDALAEQDIDTLQALRAKFKRLDDIDKVLQHLDDMGELPASLSPFLNQE